MNKSFGMLGGTAMLAAIFTLGAAGAETPRPRSAPKPVSVPGAGQEAAKNLKLSSDLLELARLSRTEGLPGAQRFAESRAIALVDAAVRVVIQTRREDVAAVKRGVEALGGTFESAASDLVLARVPVSALEALTLLEPVKVVRRPEAPTTFETPSQGVSVIGASAWHQAGYRGSGVKVAVLDVGFQGYQSLMGTDLPVIPASRIRSFSGDITGGGDGHGTAVAEIVHDVAPDAELYLANASNEVELENAVQWLIEQRVNVINASWGFPCGGALDGTGRTHSLVQRAAEAGILWVNAAGNFAQYHWSGTFSDSNDDRWNNFSTTEDANRVFLNSGEDVRACIAWDDWTAKDQDYDLYVWNSAGTVVASSTDSQSGPSTHDPKESVSFTASATGEYFIGIKSDRTTRNAAMQLNVYPAGAECAIATVADRAAKSDGTLSSLRAFRDEVLKPSVSGQALIASYYRHSREVVRILLLHPSLALDAASLVRESGPAVSSVVGFRRSGAIGTSFVITADLVARVETFMDKVGAFASPALSEELGTLRAGLGLSGAAGQTVAEYCGRLFRPEALDGATPSGAYPTPGYMRYMTTQSSLVPPADSPYALAVGATNWATDTVEDFSSQGPTADGRLKPDLAAPDGVCTATYGDCAAAGFLGTSAAAPHVAGAAALVREIYPSATSAELAVLLRSRVMDLPPAGPDNVTGAGRLSLGMPGTTCSLSCTAKGPATGTAWTTVAFGASATPTNCSGTVSYSWSFGDGVTSSEQNPSYFYAGAGSYGWRMTASISGVTCTSSGTISVVAPANAVHLERIDDTRSPLTLDTRPGDELYLYYALKRTSGELLPATAFSFDLAFSGATPGASGAWAWSVQAPGVVKLTLRPDVLSFSSNSARLTFPHGSGLLRVDGVPATLGNTLADVSLSHLKSPYTDVYDVYGEGSAGASGTIGSAGVGAGVAKASIAAAKLSVKGSSGVGFTMELGPDGGLALERRTALSLAGSLEMPSSELKVISVAKINGPGLRAGMERGSEFGQRIEYSGDDVLSEQARVTNAAFFLETASLGGNLVPMPLLGLLLKAAVSSALSLSGADELVAAAKRETWVGATLGGSVSASLASVELPVASTTPISLTAASFEGVLASRSTRLYVPGGGGSVFDGLENRWTLGLSADRAPFGFDVQLRRVFGPAWGSNYSFSASVLTELSAGGALRTAGVDLSVQSGAGGDIGLFRWQDYDGLDVRFRLGNTTVLGALRNESQAQLRALAGEVAQTLNLTADSASSTAQFILDRAEAVAPTGVVAVVAEADRKNGRVQGAELEFDFELSAGLGFGVSLGFDASWEQTRVVEDAVRACRADGKSWDLQKNEKPVSWRSAPSFQDLLSERVFSGVGPLIQKAFRNLLGSIFSILGFSAAPEGEGLRATAPLTVVDPTTGRPGGWALFPDSYRGWSASLQTGDPARPEASGGGLAPVSLRWAYTTREVFEGPAPSSRRASLELAATSSTRLTLIGNFVTLNVMPSGGATPDPLPSPVILTAALYTDQVTRMGADLARLAEARIYRYDEGSGAWQLVGGSVAADGSSVSASVTRPGTYAPGIVTTIPAGDSDGDGLLDTDEDKNGNGIIDAGESDPYIWDTDGDGVSDGEERARGTDPLDSTSVPNRAPVLGYLSNRTLRVGEALALTLRASDLDGDTVRFSASGLPSGASLNATTGAFSFTPQQAGKWRITFTATDVPRSGAALSDTQTILIEAQRVATDSELTTLTRAVPIVLDVYGANFSHYTTELTLTNRGNTTVSLTYRYQASIGDPAGSGAVADTLTPGEQRTIPNALSYLRSLGLSIPMAATAGSQGGVLLVRFDGAESEEAVAVTARTTTATTTPQPAGAAGLSYAGVPPLGASVGSLIVYGLRDNTQDRANVAVFNPTSTPVTVRMTAFSGDATGYSSVVRDSLELPAFGWTQVSNVFSGTGIASGWVTVQRTSSSGRFGAYGVINDNTTNDGSFVLPTAGTISGNRLTVPVLVETSAFRSELVLANRGSSTATLTLRYAERLTPALGAGGTATIQLRPREQQVIPDAIQYLRTKGVAIGAMGAGSYAGALRVSVSGASLSEVFAGVRTAAPSPAGGQFGLFTPGVYESETAGAEAYVYGLRADGTSRSNLAVVHAGSDSDGGLTLEVQVYDGDRGGAAEGSPRVISLSPGQWEQITGILGGVAVRNGWVRVRRTAGTAGWLAYGVVNDGSNPGERTGDGAYVPMTVKAGAATPPQGNEVTLTLPGGVPLVMVKIPAGTFQMGSPTSERNRVEGETLHTVTLTSDYYMARYLVTQGQWQAVMGTAASSECGSYGVGTSYPVYCVSWNDIRGTGGFVDRLNAYLTSTGQAGAGKVRLPTEAEWERAARGGAQTRFSFGDALECDDACGACPSADPFVWWCGNSNSASHPVGTKQANPYGLFDMHGSEWEWCEDWFGAYGFSAQTNPTGPPTGSSRVFRGGYWGAYLQAVRPASRNAAFPNVRGNYSGFRLSLSF